MLSLIRRESHTSTSSFLNRKSIHKRGIDSSSPAKLHNSVGPRRLARSLLLSLSRRAEIPSGVDSMSRESTFEIGSSDYSKPSTGGKATEDTTQAQEPVQRVGGSSVASDYGFTASTASSEAGVVGKDDVGTIASQAQVELRAALLPLRQGQNVPNEGPEPSQQPALYKYLLVDDNDINLKILASFMKRLGHGYDTAANGLEALQLYTANPGLYSFVLMGK